MEGRLVAAGRLLERTRTKAGLTKSELARLARIHPRTIRRIEIGQPADLAMYEAIADVLGWDVDWFLRAHELLDPHGADGPDLCARRALEQSAMTGWFGPAGLAYLRALHESARDAPGPDGRFELLARGFSHELEARRARARR